MLRVTVEVVPQGQEARARKLAVVTISNLSGLAPVSAYDVALDGNSVALVREHTRADGWIPLVVRALERVPFVALRDGHPGYDPTGKGDGNG